jgi:AAA domain, putative AbiEii toxin, Type IV TA system/Overcoming lysogenization defect protein-like, TOPRIM domain
MAITVRLNEVSFSGGEVVSIADPSVIVIVGPNNSGKSVALREIQDHLSTGPRPPYMPYRVIVGVDFTREGETADLEAWLEEHSQAMTERSNGMRFYSAPGARLSRADAEAQWNAHSQVPALGPSLAPFFILQASTDQRLTLVQQGAHWNPLSEAPSQPLQILFADPSREDALSGLSVEAFGAPLHLSRFPGGPIDLHVGTPTSGVSATTINPEYVDEVAQMPTVQAQGDGMRSFIGIMLALTAAPYRLVLIDEPEAFLHPPQARLLGRRLGVEARHTQVVTATHSVDFLIGLLTSGVTNTTVVRLTRDGDVNHVAVLEPDLIRRIWNDPLLSASNILDGLFHRGVVLCEADSDARYYGSVLEAARGDASHELFFTHCNGKTRMPMVTRALRALNVPVVAIADLDLLREKAGARDLVEALGGDWSDYERDWTVLNAAVTSKSVAPAVSDVREAVDTALEAAAAEGVKLTRSTSEQIRKATKVEDGWSIVKNDGVAAFPRGDASTAGETLLARLRELGLFLVPVGELEGWHPTVSGHGPDWLGSVIEERRHQESGAHRDFVEDAATWFDNAAVGTETPSD